MANVLEVGGVPERQHNDLIVDSDGGLDFLFLVLNDECFLGSVGLVAVHAPPLHGIFVAAHLEGVGEGELLLEGQGLSQEHEAGEEDKAVHMLMMILTK